VPRALLAQLIAVKQIIGQKFYGAALPRQDHTLKTFYLDHLFEPIDNTGVQFRSASLVLSSTGKLDAYYQKPSESTFTTSPVFNHPSDVNEALVAFLLRQYPLEQASSVRPQASQKGVATDTLHDSRAFEQQFTGFPLSLF
jgi:hypothetical protein